MSPLFMTSELKHHFEKLSDELFKELKKNESINFNLIAENQDYIRWNNSRVRQATHVLQIELELHFQNGKNSIQYNCNLSGQWTSDLNLLKSLLDLARKETDILPDDPYYVPYSNYGCSEKNFHGKTPQTEELFSFFEKETQGTDFTGLFANGTQIRANKNNQGQSHWFSNQSFFMDYSLYTQNQDLENKAVKNLFSDQNWNKDIFLEQFQSSKNQLSLLKRKNKSISPGSYRVYLAPAAAADIFGILSWGAVSYSAYKRGSCALQKVIEGHEHFSNLFSLKENFNLGVCPQFNSLGEVASTELNIITEGKVKSLLVNMKTSKEFQVPSNGADSNMWGGEYLRSPEIKGGQLALSDVLQKLGTGIFIGNVHYLNWSDLQNARVTGMTRYACFWVEGGEIQAPIQDLRFDVSLFHILGTGLVALTEETQLFTSIETYLRRSLGGIKTPGLLVDDFKFTL